ncbi:hypothetical protein OF83DRAFT_1167864 [Amylostereum chailletii]|nr:hypothetical protein OF83DRAFT_1167864 [Amylostereum chailletii]
MDGCVFMVVHRGGGSFRLRLPPVPTIEESPLVTAPKKLPRTIATRRRKNANQPVERLFPEILAAIFTFHSYNQPNFYDCGGPIESGRSYSPNLGWIKVTHVSHPWREVALSCPSLWWNVTCSLGPEWTKRFISRSKSVPIRLDIWAPRRSTWEDRYYLAYANLHRAHTITLCDNVRPDFLCSPAPLLRDLRIHVPEGGGPGSWPSGMLGDHAPKLRAFTEPEFPKDRLSPTIFGAFKRMSGLRTLSLSATRFTDKVDPSLDLTHGNPRTLLPNLHVLDLGDALGTTVAILEGIEWPSSTHVHIKANLDNDAPEKRTPALAQICARLAESDAHSTDLQTLFVLSQRVSGRSVKISHSLSAANPPDEMDSYWDSSKWASAFGAYRRVEHIHVRQGNALGLLQALTSDVTHGQSLSAHEYLFPALVSLGLSGMKNSTTPNIGASTSTTKLSIRTDMCRLLRRAVEMRRVIGRRIHTLYLEEGMVELPWVRELAHLVRVVGVPVDC